MPSCSVSRRALALSPFPSCSPAPALSASSLSFLLYLNFPISHYKTQDTLKRMGKSDLSVGLTTSPLFCIFWLADTVVDHLFVRLTLKPLATLCCYER